MTANAFRDDPLAIVEGSKAADSDYQWFDTRQNWPWRDPSVKGWLPVLRSEMPDEASGHDEYITRGVVQLFRRPRELSDAARAEEAEIALSCLRKIEEQIFPGPSWLHPAREEASPGIFQRKETKNRFEKDGRRSLLVLHEKACSGFVVKTMGRSGGVWPWIVFLWDEEAAMADRCGLTHLEWARAKADLVHEGEIDGYRGGVPIRRSHTRRLIKMSRQAIRRVTKQSFEYAKGFKRWLDDCMGRR